MSADDRRVLATLYDLLDRPREDVDRALEREPAAFAERVRQLLEADAGADDRDLVTPEQVGWMLAQDLADGEEPAANRDPLLPELAFGAYRVVRRIGAGGMGEVFEAEQAHPRRRVAIKLLHDDATDREARDRIRWEAQVLADLQAPSLPHVVEVAEHDGRTFLVMEYIDGPTLARWCEAVGPRERIGAVVAVTRAVQLAHEAGLVHGDLKPSNVLIGGDGRPRIIDFGLATRIGDPDRPTAGTLPYLAPEQLAGYPPDPRTDVFALGVLLYEVLTGALPWGTGLPSLTAERRRRESPYRLPSRDGVGDEGLDAVVGCALAPRALRYDSAAALADDLERWLALRPVQALRGGPRYRSGLWLRRHRTKVLGACAAAAVLGLLASVPSALQQVRDATRELRAQAVLVSMEERVDAAPGDDAVVDTLLDAWSHLPELRGTRALAASFRRRAASAARGDQTERALELLARAHATTDDPDDRRRTLVALAGVFEQQHDWYALRRVIERLDPESGDAPELQRKALLAAAGLRRLDEAARHDATPIAAVLAALAPATRTAYRPTEVMPLPATSPPPASGGKSPGLVLVEEDGARLVLLDRDLELRRAVPLPQFGTLGGQPKLIATDPPTLLVAASDGAGLGLWRLGDEGLVERWRTTAPESVADAVVADLDGDGERFLYLGGQREILAFPLDSGGTPQHPYPSGDEAPSDLVSLLAGDLDGDGTPELIVSRGPWTAFDVRVYRLDGSEPHLREVARVKLGGEPAVTVLRGADGVARLAVVKPNTYPADDVFGPEQPFGRAPGLYLFRLDGERLVEDAFLPGPPDLAALPLPPLTADLDGDGVEDLVLGVGGAHHATWLVRQLPDLRLDDAWLHAFIPLAVAELDSDPQAELLGRLPDDDHHLWILGTGDERLPQWTPNHLPALVTPTPPIAAPVADLVDLGLLDPAARALVALADTEPDPLSAGRMFEAAARLHLALGHHREAADLLGAALPRMAGAPPDEVDRVAQARADALLTHHRFAELSVPGQDPHPLAALDEPTVTLDLTHDLPEALALRPSGAVWHGAGRGLEIHAVAGDGPLFELPLDVVHGRVSVEVALETQAMDPGAILSLELWDPQERLVGSLSVRAWGGAFRVDRTPSCRGGSGPEFSVYAPLTREVDAPERVTLRLDHARGRTLCVVERGGRAYTEVTSAPALPPGRYLLRARTSWMDDLRGAAVRAVVQTLEVRGAALGGPSPMDPRAGDAFSAALDAGDIDGATAELDRLPLVDPQVRAELLGPLRRHPATTFLLLRAHDPALAEALYLEAWIPALALRGAEAQRTLDHPVPDAAWVRGADSRTVQRRADLLDARGQARRADALRTAEQ